MKFSTFESQFKSNKAGKKGMKYILAIVYNAWKLYIGIVFVITLLLLYPFFLILLQDKKYHKLTFKLNVLWSRLVRILCFYAVHVEGDISAKNEPMIICANHTSYLDIFLLYSIFPKTRFLFMGKSEILAYPLVKTFFKGLNIPVYRSDRIKAAKSFIQARNAMQNNWNIVIFPEGGIPYETPYLAPFKNGTFKLAISAKAGIQPMTFCNNYYLFSDPEAIYDRAMPGLSSVIIHPYLSSTEVSAETVEKLNERVYASINSRLPQKNA
jgi:1-acyl-sn-glycerol-3-phosphate acyltransferase